MNTETVQIIDYESRYAARFKSLNIAWISNYFEVEPHDLEQLDHPEDHILNNGGRILFARLGETIVGTVALIKVDEATMELAKMAVDETIRGQGIGRKLCLTAIEKARQAGVTQLVLESNRKLAPALHLYRTVGFQEVAMIETPYSRADIRMSIELRPPHTPK